MSDVGLQGLKVAEVDGNTVAKIKELEKELNLEDIYLIALTKD